MAITATVPAAARVGSADRQVSVPPVGLAGWTPATDLVSGVGIPALLAAAARRWSAQPAAAAALAWKSYSYRVAMAAVVGYATTRRVPLPRAEDLLVLYSQTPPFVSALHRRPVVAVLADDPLAGTANSLVLPDRPALLGALRTALLDEHLTPVLGHLRDRTRLGRRTLLGSLASGVATAVSRSATTPGGPPLAAPALDTATELLAALGVADLVELAPTPAGDLLVERRTCCLAFTLPTPKICSGCCLRVT